MADVFVVATIDKTETISVSESLAKTKLAVINVVFNRSDLVGAAQANAVANVTNTGNTVSFALGNATFLGSALGSTLGGIATNFFNGLDGASTAMLIFKSASITDSINGNQGIVGVNQDVGNMANQANIVAFATDVTSPTGSTFANSQADISQDNQNNFVWHVESPFTGSGPPTNLSATIDGSINDNIGVVGVNQNAGNMNNQTNSLALAVGPDAVYALAEANLGQENAHNIVMELNTGKADTITGSINGNTGIVQVNQSVGNMNNQASAFSISVLTSTVSISP
jgi:hypothetical protein